MSKTKRIYNEKKIKKAKRVNIDKGETTVSGGGIPYTRKSHICMRGDCSCRAPRREKTFRHRNKEELRFRLAQEFRAEQIPVTDQAPWSLIEIHP